MTEEIPFEEVPLEADALTKLYIHDGSEVHKNTVRAQLEHRIELVKYWKIRKGELVLELGCGQGDCTLALAAAVGLTGRVIACDPAPPDYGSPYTLGEAQDHIKKSPLGPRITFLQTDTLTFLQYTESIFDTAVLAHSIWYFSSPDQLKLILSWLSKRARRICIAEWSLSAANDPRGFPHVLAALTQASWESRKVDSTSNIRTILSSTSIKDIAAACGLVLRQEKIFSPVDGVLDGKWEADFVMSYGYRKEVEQTLKWKEQEREKAVMLALIDATATNYNAVVARGEIIKSMDVWVATYIKKNTLPAVPSSK